jgi:hypothetical protein
MREPNRRAVRRWTTCPTLKTRWMGLEASTILGTELQRACWRTSHSCVWQAQQRVLWRRWIGDRCSALVNRGAYEGGCHVLRQQREIRVARWAGGWGRMSRRGRRSRRWGHPGVMDITSWQSSPPVRMFRRRRIVCMPALHEANAARRWPEYTGSVP